MSANLTAEQRDMMIRANAAALAGFGQLASSLVESLKRSLGVRPCYGKFKLTEADECALEVVESPDHHINAAGDES